MMPNTPGNLHGNAPDTAPIALILIDVINDLSFEEGAQLLEHALPAAQRIVTLKQKAKALGIPVIYANDNFGRWRSDFREVVDHSLSDDVVGAPIAALLQPDDDDYFVLKPKHSAFFATTLETLLRHLGATHLILAGFTGDICILFTANDAYMRDYKIYVPSDCVASQTEDHNQYALDYLSRVLSIDTTPSADLNLKALLELVKHTAS